jgi:hypothetical protein
MLLTLFVIPVMYTLFGSTKQEVKARERISRVGGVPRRQGGGAVLAPAA